MKVTIEEFYKWANLSDAVIFLDKKSGKHIISLWDKDFMRNNKKKLKFLCGVTLDGVEIWFPKSRNKEIEVAEGVLYILRNTYGKKYCVSLLCAQHITASIEAGFFVPTH